jgi:hypothetical protein
VNLRSVFLENILNELEFAPHINSIVYFFLFKGINYVRGLQKFLMCHILRKSPIFAPSRLRVLRVGILQAFGVIGPIGRKVGLANPRQRQVSPMPDIQHRDKTCDFLYLRGTLFCYLCMALRIFGVFTDENFFYTIF